MKGCTEFSWENPNYDPFPCYQIASKSLQVTKFVFGECFLKASASSCDFAFTFSCGQEPEQAGEENFVPWFCDPWETKKSNILRMTSPFQRGYSISSSAHNPLIGLLTMAVTDSAKY